MKRIIILLFATLIFTSCVDEGFSYYKAYYQATEALLDSLYSFDFDHDILWQDTIMETAEYEQYETIIDLINGNIYN